MRLVAAAPFLPSLLVGQIIAPHPVDAVRTGVFQNLAIRESSGVARSRAMPGVLFTINDSGNDPVVFAFDSSGRDLGQWHVPGVRNRDWEAIAVGPCPVGSCLYIGDLGDNAERRPSVTVYRVREPTRLHRVGGTDEATATELDSLVIRYPDGPHDVEAMWVDGAGTISLVTKGRSGGIRRFRLPGAAFGSGHPAMAELLEVVPVAPDARFGRWVTDAALAPDGRRVAIRTYTELYLFPLLPLGHLGTPLVCNLAGLEPQGEGVEWLDGIRLVLTSESVDGRGPGPIHVVRCGG
jgi:hypothetical protein